jgi:hypothetical protein
MVADGATDLPDIGTSMRSSDPFVVAVWAAALFGLLEGVVLNIARAYPAILAPYKVSAHVLWIAPVVDVSIFLPTAAGLLVFLRAVRRWVSTSQLLLVFGVFVLLGAVSVATAPKIIHPVSAAVLSAGVAVASCRKLRGHERQLAAYLRRRVALVPLAIVALALGVSGYERAREQWERSQLPPVQIGRQAIRPDCEPAGLVVRRCLHASSHAERDDRTAIIEASAP